ncbi:hypothetical protein TNCV_1894281 [Trichonephila clavipes]|nr:hypothetical protein TNCV_1894281 [Trichonephila clavipes]
MARVLQVHPGNDGLVRVATVKTKDSVFKRPVHKLHKLPIYPNFFGYRTFQNKFCFRGKYSPRNSSSVLALQNNDEEKELNFCWGMTNDRGSGRSPCQDLPSCRIRL